MHARSLHRLLKALANGTLLAEAASARLAPTALGVVLRRNASGAARTAVLTLAGEWQ
jgi:hypothetical protein